MRLAIASMLLMAGCASAADAPPPRAPSSEETFGSGAPLRYLVLGDSTAVAVGGTYERGIARQSARHLAASHQVVLKNVAVSGARVHDVLTEQLPRVGSFVPDVVLLDVGANDVVHLTRAAPLERELEAILQDLFSRNRNVKIVVTGSADMSSPPRIPRVLRGLSGHRTRVLHRVFERAVATHHLTFAPIARDTGPAFKRDHSLFDADRFHPNDRGYELWIAVINAALDRAMAGPSHN
jgi:lysophospholipase L1-like esterase